MIKFTQRQLKDMVYYGYAWDASHFTDSDYWSIMKNEGNIRRIGYSCGKYGCNGLLLQGCETGKLFAIIGRTPALYLFG